MMDNDRMDNEMMNNNMTDSDMMDIKDEMGMYMYPELVQMINECEVTCEHMTYYLLMMKLNSERMAQFGLLRDCSDFCGLTARFIARDSYMSKVLADVCAEICNLCGKECARYPDEMSQHCAEICLNCAKYCKQFARED